MRVFISWKSVWDAQYQSHIRKATMRSENVAKYLENGNLRLEVWRSLFVKYIYYILKYMIFLQRIHCTNLPNWLMNYGVETQGSMKAAKTFLIL